MEKQTDIKSCNCKSDFQDNRYGKGNRVMNWARKATSTGGWRCTVCGKTK